MRKFLLTIMVSAFFFSTVVNAQQTNKYMPWLIDIGYGNSLYNGVKTTQLLLFVDLPGLANKIDQFEYSGKINAEFINENQRNTFLIGFVPMLRFNMKLMNFPFFIKGGIGANFVNQSRIGRRNIGGNFIFSDMLSVGVKLFNSKFYSLAISYLFRHISNAGLYSSNEGFNSQYIVLTLLIL